jgi:hypothetical protein
MGNSGTEQAGTDTFDVRSTRVGHKRPDILDVEPTCFLHTATAIYALDDDGVCCYVTGHDGNDAGAAVRCVGAQYVACFDRASAEGLAAQPCAGGQALFVGRGTDMRAALLRTSALTRVEFVGDDGAKTPQPGAAHDAPAAPMATRFDPRVTRLGMPSVQLP